jgi:hypothetical protein
MSTEMINISVDLEAYKAIEGRRESFNQSHNDIIKQWFGLKKKNQSTVPLEIRDNELPSRHLRKRVTGNYSFVILGQSYHFSGLKESYIECLNLLNKKDPNFFAALSKVETPHRRVISEDPSKLYKKSPHLAKNHAIKLDDKWWIDGNLSQLQVESRLEDACKIAGLRFGSDLTLEFPGE